MAAKTSYGAAAREFIDIFEDYFCGTSSQPILLIHANELTPQTCDATEKSLVALGYSPNSWSRLTLKTSSDVDALDTQSVMLFIEGLDPLHIVCADNESMRLINEAYRINLKPNGVNRIMGRTSICFDNLNELIVDEKGKRVVWELFKALR